MNLDAPSDSPLPWRGARAAGNTDEVTENDSDEDVTTSDDSDEDDDEEEDAPPPNIDPDPRPATRGGGRGGVPWLHAETPLGGRLSAARRVTGSNGRRRRGQKQAVYGAV